jgi:outer membrane protein TolC
VANPDLAALDHLIQSRQKTVVLAKKKGFPDFTFGVEYTQLGRPPTTRPDRPYPATLSALARQTTNLQNQSGGLAQAAGQLITGQPVQLPSPQVNATSFIDLYSVVTANEPIAYPRNPADNLMVSMQMNVPIWRKRVKAGVQEARHLEQAARHQKRREANALDTAARQAHYEIANAQRRLEILQDTLIEQARQIYESLQTTYAAGQEGADFLDVLDSVKTMLDYELEQAQVTKDLHVAAAQLELLLGGPWTSEPEPAETSL